MIASTDGKNKVKRNSFLFSDKPNLSDKYLKHEEMKLKKSKLLKTKVHV